MKNYLLAAALLAVTTPALAIPSGPVNLVTNGGFEDADHGWGFPEDGYHIVGGTGDMTAYRGSMMAASGCYDSFACPIGQVLDTVVGRRYRISFAFNPGAGADDGGGNTVVTFGNTRLVDLVGGAPGWTRHRFTAVATDVDTTLQFFGYQNNGASGIDDVSVTAAVPEPATWAMMLGGFGLAGAALRRRSDALAA